jgi:hypothetical protein
VPGTAAVPDEPGSDIPIWLVLGLVVLMIAGGGLVAYVLLHHESEKQSGPSYPKAWDPRIAPYVKIVEKQRGLTFLHPVAVRFLPDKDFEKTVTTDEKDISKDDRRDMERGAGLLRAFGLLSGKVDLFSASNDVSGSGTLAYYSFADKRVTIRGEKLVRAARPTLVHELTHALQDQHFGIGDRLREAAKRDEKRSTGEYSVLDAIVEGDAERTADGYLATLSPAQRRAIAASAETQDKRAAETYAKVPAVVVTFFTAPYTLGEALVQAIAQDGGNAAVDDLLRDSPTHDAALLDPFRVLLGDQDAATPPKPVVDKGDKAFDDGEFGAVTWYLMLAERLPLTDALTIVDGWGGDSYVAYEHDGVTCARASYRGQDAAATGRMLTALRQWIAAVPGSPASVRSEGSGLLFQSCDPGTGTRKGKEDSAQAVALAVSRTNLGVIVMRAGAPDRYARCISDKLIHAYTLAQLSDPGFGKNDPSVRANIQRMAAACR